MNYLACEVSSVLSLSSAHTLSPQNVHFVGGTRPKSNNPKENYVVRNSTTCHTV